MPRFSTVIPVYRNGANIPDLLTALSGVRPEIRSDLSVVSVIDGSPAGSGNAFAANTHTAHVTRS